MATNSLPFGCDAIIPSPQAPLHEMLDRWSAIPQHLPALIVVPNSEQDVIDAINYAKGARLVVVVGGGGHGFVALSAKTLYLDMKKMNEVVLDEKAGQVTVGGGTLTGLVIETCTKAGFHTTWTNSNGVGMVGSVLGGGSTPMNGIHGLMIDQLLSVRIVTAEGETLDLGPSSAGEELALLKALSGAGHGLGVVTSMTLKAFPLTSLRMADDEVWTRRLIFPAEAIDLAADTYVKLLPPARPQHTVLTFVRSPANSPAPGAPMIILSASYYGPSEDAEHATKLLFDESITSNAIQALTVKTHIARMNDAYAVFSEHGDYKNISSAWLDVMPHAAIKAAFQQWLDFTANYEDAERCVVAHSTHNPEESISIGEAYQGQARYFESRHRGTCVFVFSWAKKHQTVQPMREFASGIKELYRRAQPTSHLPRTFPNNMQSDTKMEEMFTEDRINELDRIKKWWDGYGLFWSPYGEERREKSA